MVVTTLLYCTRSWHGTPSGLSKADVRTKSGYVYGFCFKDYTILWAFHKMHFGLCIVTPQVWLTCNRWTSRTVKRAKQERARDRRLSVVVEGSSLQGYYALLILKLPAFWMSSVLDRRLALPWRWRHCLLPQCLWLFTSRHGITSQKTWIFSIKWICNAPLYSFIYIPGILTAIIWAACIVGEVIWQRWCYKAAHWLLGSTLPHVWRCDFRWQHPTLETQGRGRGFVLRTRN